MLTDEEMWAVVRKGRELSEVCRELIRRANAAGGKDNVTAVVCEA